MKKFRMIISAFLTAVTICSIMTTVSATESQPEIDFGTPIKVTEYIDEYGNHVVEEIYVALVSGTIGGSNAGTAPYSEDDSGEGWFQKSKYITNSKNESTCTIRAYFTWGDGNVTVCDPIGWTDIGSTATTVYDEECTTGTGGIFTKNAYAKYSFKTKNAFGITQSDSIKLTVNAKGEAS